MAAHPERPDVFLELPLEQLTKPDLEKRRYPLVIVTDLEGPYILGDTSYNIMSENVQPNPYEFGNKLIDDAGIDYGGELFAETFRWYFESSFSKGFGQEGSDVVLGLASLLYFGVNDNNLIKEVRKSTKAPGSAKYLNYLHAQDALVVAVTTAWEEPHRGLVVKDIGLDQLIGTDFSLDEARERLMQSDAGTPKLSIRSRPSSKAAGLRERHRDGCGEACASASAASLGRPSRRARLSRLFEQLLRASRATVRGSGTATGASRRRADKLGREGGAVGCGFGRAVSPKIRPFDHSPAEEGTDVLWLLAISDRDLALAHAHVAFLEIGTPLFFCTRTSVFAIIIR